MVLCHTSSDTLVKKCICVTSKEFEYYNELTSPMSYHDLFIGIVNINPSQWTFGVALRLSFDSVGWGMLVSRVIFGILLESAEA